MCESLPGLWALPGAWGPDYIVTRRPAMGLPLGLGCLWAAQGSHRAHSRSLHSLPWGLQSNIDTDHWVDFSSTRTTHFIDPKGSTMELFC